MASPLAWFGSGLKLTVFRDTWASKNSGGEQPGEVIDDAKRFNTKLHEWERFYNFA